ncbi:MAG: TonB-dependent receptor [Opitutales bacterium]|nr:TonB-dependent receptor [Opitutales bacterium]
MLLQIRYPKIKTIGLLLIIGLKCYSQDTTTDDDAYELSPFIIESGSEDSWVQATSHTAARTNVEIKNLSKSVTVLTSEFLSEIAADDYSDVLDFVSNVSIQGESTALFNQNTFFFRGFRQNEHYRNNIRGSFFSDVVDSATIDRVEILKGPSSLLAGTSEPGGVMNSITKRPLLSGSGGYIKLGYGTDNYMRAELDYSAQLNESISFRYVTALTDSDGWREWEGNSNYVQYGAINWKLTPKTTLLLTFEMLDQDITMADGAWLISTEDGRRVYADLEGLIPWDFNTMGPDSLRSQEHFKFFAELTHQLAENVYFRYAANWEDVEFHDSRPSGGGSLRGMFETFDPNAPDSIEIGGRWNYDNIYFETWTHQADIFAQLEYADIQHDLTVGVEYTDLMRERPRWAQRGTRTRVSLNQAKEINASGGRRFEQLLGPDAGSSINRWELTFRERWAYIINNQFRAFDDKLIANLGYRIARGDAWDTNYRFFDANGDLSIDQSERAAGNAAADIADEDAETLSAGLLYKINDNLSVYGNYAESYTGADPGRAFNIPAWWDYVDEIGSNPGENWQDLPDAEQDALRDFIDSNPDRFSKPQEPEFGEGWEAGIKYVNDANTFSATLAYFSIEKNNVITTTLPAGIPPGGPGRYQAGVREASGWELDLMYRPTENYQIMLGGGQLTVEDLPVADGQIKRSTDDIPELSWHVYHQYIGEGMLKGWKFNNGITWVDDRPDGVNSFTGIARTTHPSYYRVDLGASYETEIKGYLTKFHLNVSNVLDEKYIVGQASKGYPRKFILSVTTYLK